VATYYTPIVGGGPVSFGLVLFDVNLFVALWRKDVFPTLQSPIRITKIGFLSYFYRLLRWMLTLLAFKRMDKGGSPDCLFVSLGIIFVYCFYLIG
jgi:hypothetical protein